MSISLLPLCATGTIVDRVGDVGPNVYKHIPFAHHLWSPSGQILTFPGSQIPQNTNPRLGPVLMPDTFQKDCCRCA